MLAVLVAYISLRLIPSDREISLDSIRNDLGVSRAEQVSLMLTWGRRRSSPRVS
jgi:hypothetical protein